eukprot:1838114-Prymnesium_polylepis.1
MSKDETSNIVRNATVPPPRMFVCLKRKEADDVMDMMRNFASTLFLAIPMMSDRRQKAEATHTAMVAQALVTDPQGVVTVGLPAYTSSPATPSGAI